MIISKNGNDITLTAANGEVIGKSTSHEIMLNTQELIKIIADFEERLQALE